MNIITTILLFFLLVLNNANRIAGKISILSPVSFSVEVNYTTANIIGEPEYSYSTAKFPAWIFPVHFDSEKACTPALSFNTSLASVLKFVNIPFRFSELRLLFLIDWLNDARKSGCRSLADAMNNIEAKIINRLVVPSNATFLAKTSIPLIFMNNEHNLFKVAPPYVNIGDLRDGIFIDSFAVYNDIMQRVGNNSRPLLVYVSREPGQWNEYFESTAYNLIHWTFVAIDMLLISLGCAQVYFILYSRRNDLSFKMLRIIHGSHLLLRLNAIIFLIGSASGLVEKIQSIIGAAFLFGYWTLAIWTFSGVFISWADIANRIRPRKHYLVFCYIGKVTIIATPILCIGVILGFAYPSLNQVIVISRLLFYICVNLSMLTQSCFFVLLSFNLLIHLVKGRIDPRVLLQLQRLTFVGVMVLLSGFFIIAGVILFNTPIGLGIEGYQTQNIMLYIGGILAQSSIFTLPVSDAVVEEETYDSAPMSQSFFPPPLPQSSEIESSFVPIDGSSTQLRSSLDINGPAS